MSAYVCSSLHIAWLARFIVATAPNARYETVLTAMIDANLTSRNAAIAAFRAEVATAYARFAAQADGWWLKQFDCYAYQACEHPQWDSSRAKGFVDQAIRLLFPNDQERIEAGQAAAYHRAPWGIDDWNEWSPGNDPILRDFIPQAPSVAA